MIIDVMGFAVIVSAISMNLLAWAATIAYCARVRIVGRSITIKHEDIANILKSTKEYIDKVNCEQETIHERLTRIERSLKKLEEA